MKIYIEVDTNDGDYVGDLKDITEKNAARLTDLINKSGDELAQWQEGDCAEQNPIDAYPDFTEEEIEFISDLMPYSEYGFHTVEKITLLEEMATLV